MKFNLLVFIILSFSFCFAQTDTSGTQEKSEKLNLSKSVKTESLWLLKITNDINSMKFSEYAFLYSKSLGHLDGSENKGFSPNEYMLNPLRYQLQNKPSLLTQVLTVATYGAAAYMAGAHLVKYWEKYKEDLGLKK